MKYVIVYWTRFGNNKRIVDYLAGKFQGEVQIFKTDEIEPEKIPDADYYIFSAAAEKFSVQKNMRKFMGALENMNNKKFGVINTHASKSGKWLVKMGKILDNKGMVRVAEVDFQILGGMNDQSKIVEGWEAKLDEFCFKLQ